MSTTSYAEFLRGKLQLEARGSLREMITTVVQSVTAWVKERDRAVTERDAAVNHATIVSQELTGLRARVAAHVVTDAAVRRPTADTDDVVDKALRASLEIVTRERDIAQDNYAKASQERDEYRRELQRLGHDPDRLVWLEKRTTELEQECGTVMLDRDGLRVERDRLRESVRELTAQCLDMQGQVEYWKTPNMSVIEGRKRLEAEVARITAERDAARTERDDRERAALVALDTCRASLARLRSIFGLLSTADGVDDLAAECETARAEVARLRFGDPCAAAQVTQLGAALGEARADLAFARAEVAKLTEQLNGARLARDDYASVSQGLEAERVAGIAEVKRLVVERDAAIVAREEAVKARDFAKSETVRVAAEVELACKERHAIVAARDRDWHGALWQAFGTALQPDDAPHAAVRKVKAQTDAQEAEACRELPVCAECGLTAERDTARSELHSREADRVAAKNEAARLRESVKELEGERDAARAALADALNGEPVAIAPTTAPTPAPVTAPTLTRRKLPDERKADGVKLRINDPSMIQRCPECKQPKPGSPRCTSFMLHAGFHPTDGALLEFFLRTDRERRSDLIASLLDGWATSSSYALQLGADLEWIVEKASYQHDESGGNPMVWDETTGKYVQHPVFGHVDSMLDLIARTLDRIHKGLPATSLTDAEKAERARKLAAQAAEPTP